MENRQEPSNSDEISKMMSNDCEIDVVHLYPICKHVPHVRRPPEIEKTQIEYVKYSKNGSLRSYLWLVIGNGNVNCRVAR